MAKGKMTKQSIGNIEEDVVKVEQVSDMVSVNAVPQSQSRKPEQVKSDNTTAFKDTMPSLTPQEVEPVEKYILVIPSNQPKRAKSKK